jgi:hypothetical protein
MSLRRARPALLAVGLALALPLSTAVPDLAQATGGASPSVNAARVEGTGRVSPAKAAETDPMLGDVAFSVPSRTFSGSLQVSLTTSLSGATVRYTTDGSVPTTSSPAASGALSLSTSTRLRAQAFSGATAVGKPSSAFYLKQAVTQQHDLPLVIVDDFGKGAPTKTTDLDAAVMTFDGSTTTTLSDAPALVSRAGIHLRGQSSATFAKPQYKVELRDNLDEDVDLPLLGMPAESDWVLRGPFSDKSLIRNAMMFDLARDLGRWAPRYRFVELYLNVGDATVGPEDYMGVYMVMETIKNQKDRLDLKKLKDDDLTEPDIEGGYIVKFEWKAAEEPIIACTATANCFRDLELADPKDAVPAQVQWITDYLNRFNTRLHDSDFADPDTGYPTWIDVPSFVDTVILNELSRDMDAYVRSADFFKDRDGKLTSGPGWDYDLTFGVGGFFGNNQTSGWQYEQITQRQPAPNDWIPRLMSDPAFANEVRARWQDLRRGVLSDAALDTRVAELTAGLTNAAQRNFQEFPNLASGMVGFFQTSTQPTWQGQVDVLKTWMHARAAWLDSTAGWGATTTPTPTRTTPTTTTPQPTSTTSTTSTTKTKTKTNTKTTSRTRTSPVKVTKTTKICRTNKKGVKSCKTKTVTVRPGKTNVGASSVSQTPWLAGR